MGFISKVTIILYVLVNVFIQWQNASTPVSELSEGVSTLPVGTLESDNDTNSSGLTTESMGMSTEVNIDNPSDYCPDGLSCSDLAPECLNCQFNTSCIYGRVDTVDCTVKDPVQCEGDRTFTREFTCRFCYQVEHWLYKCESNTTCTVVSSPPRSTYISKCTVNTDVMCMENETQTQTTRMRNNPCIPDDIPMPDPGSSDNSSDYTLEGQNSALSPLSQINPLPPEDQLELVQDNTTVSSSSQINPPPPEDQLKLVQDNTTVSPSSQINPLPPEDQLEIVQGCFPDLQDSINQFHSHMTCSGKCSSLSPDECKQQYQMKNRFNHQWLFSRNLTYCPTTGIWWLAFREKNGMYCLLCRKHNCINQQNKSKTYSADPAVRYKKGALESHAASAQHKAAIQLEIMQRLSCFHKDIVRTQHVKHEVYFKVFTAIYWLVKSGIPIRQALPLIKLIEQLGYSDIKFFQHRAPESLRQIILALGEVTLNNILTKLGRDKFGLLVDEVTDISTKEQMIAFIQFVTTEGQVETPFLFVADCLEDSDSANSSTLLNVIMENLTKCNLITDNISGFVSDGASVMVGVNEGVAAKLKRLNPKILTVDCIAHRLALACTYSNKDISFMGQVEDVLRQLWQFMENSPKRSSAFIKVQQQLQHIHLTTEKGRRKVAHKLKKACSTRWLSFDASVQSFHRDIEAVIQTLNILQQDVVATGLLIKIRQLKFIAAVYILKSVLPILSQLSREFQWSSVSYSHIQPLIESTKGKLSDLVVNRTPITELQEDLGPDGRLNRIKADLVGMDSKEFHIKQMESNLTKYVSALKTNLDDRFSAAVPILGAFDVFNPEAVPPPSSSVFKTHGNKDLSTLANHFFPGETDRLQRLEAEWMNLKYQIIIWKDEMRNQLKEQREKKGCQTMTPTLWLLQKLISMKLTYLPVYPTVLSLAETILSIPVSNAWPERGASKLKFIKSRLRSHMKNDLLQALLQVSLNGPQLSESKPLVTSAVQLWLSKKQRRKLPKVRSSNIATLTIPDEWDSRETLDRAVEAVLLPTENQPESESDSDSDISD